MNRGHLHDRRSFLTRGGAVVAGLAGGVAPAWPAPRSAEENISPVEDLMREHGVLKRVLLVYDEAVRRLEAREDLPPEPLAAAAKIVRIFVEDYHEKLEEEHLFPRFRAAGKLVTLVDTLAAQHAAGRAFTDVTARHATARAMKNAGERTALITVLRGFVRMYAPHEAREDTVLFPAFRGLVSAHEYAALGEDFEKREDELFGDDGFFRVVDQVADIEKQLGIYDLASFTPKR